MPIDPDEKYWLSKKKSTKIDIEEWKTYWREAGPIRFAEEYLFCPLNVPPFPNWKELQEEFYCKACKKKHMRFRPSGVPVHLVLSEQQKEVLYDAWKNDVKLIIVSAGRGAGKTFCLAVWNCWRICCFDYYEITTMGGSAKQSKLLQKYIDYWRGQHKEVKYVVTESAKSIGNRGCRTRFHSENNYIACSPTAVMGPHVNEVQIDEECAAESKGTEGEEAIEAIDWQITGRTDTFIWRTSTSHYIMGKFYEILKSPEKHGYKAYFWGIAKHVSGRPAYMMYGDKNPKNWIPAVWWMTQEDIVKLRRKSDEEWLCWALGYPSMASGAVFRETDLDVVICNRCPVDECYPYKWGKCKLIKEFDLGDEKDPTKNVRDRRGGFDYGDPKPCALLIGGIKNKFIFILYADEQKGLGSKELIDWIKNKLNAWRAYIMNIPDSVGGNFVREALDEEGFTIHLLEEKEKAERVMNIKGIVERHAMIIPPAYWYLVQSMRSVHRDKRGKIVKHNDHSFDSCCYLCVDWGDVEGNIEDFFEIVVKGTLKKPFNVPDEPDDERYTREEEEFFNEKSRGIKLWED